MKLTKFKKIAHAYCEKYNKIVVELAPNTYYNLRTDEVEESQIECIDYHDYSYSTITNKLVPINAPKIWVKTLRKKYRKSYLRGNIPKMEKYLLDGE